MVPVASRQAGWPTGFQLSLSAACAILAAAMAPAGALAGWLAYARHSAAGLQAALLAAVTCWLSATVALMLAGLLAGTPQAISGILGGTLVRLAGPLLITAGCAALGSPLSAAGLFGYMLVFFLYALAIETVLLIGLVRGVSPLAPRGIASLSSLVPRESALSQSEKRQTEGGR